MVVIDLYCVDASMSLAALNTVGNITTASILTAMTQPRLNPDKLPKWAPSTTALNSKVAPAVMSEAAYINRLLMRHSAM